MDKFKWLTLDQILNEINNWLASYSQNMCVIQLEESILLTGIYEIRQNGFLIDEYELRLYFHEGFPIIEPDVYEDGSRIPKIATRHIFPVTGKCCLCVWEDWLINESNISIETFLSQVVRTYFLAQTIYEKEDKFPFGEFDHDLAGLLQAYSETLGVPNNLKAVRKWLALLANQEVKSNWLCSCPRRKSVKKCNCGKLEKLISSIPSYLAIRMLNRVESYALNVERSQKIQNTFS